jgi:hypothetical protein
MHLLISIAPNAARHSRFVLVAAACAVALGGCSTTGTNVTRTTFTPTQKGVGTYQWTRGTINDGSGGPIASCDPPTPPAPALPAAPNPGEMLVGYQDWRNTVTDSNGVMCPSSRATRLRGLAVFDLSAVASDLSASPHKLLTATLTYRIGSSLKIPQSAQDLDLCVRTLELARGYETPAPFSFVQLDPRFGDFPQSAPSRLGPINLPSSVPFGQTSASGPVTVNPAGPAPTVTVDVSLLISDWAEALAQEPANSAERGRLGIAFLAFGPTIQQLGLTNTPPSPVPASRSTARCTSILTGMVLTVTVGR